MVIIRLKNDNLISIIASDGLKVEFPRTPRLYIQLEIHKERNPGRPVQISLKCHMSKISKYVDFHLQPVAKQIPSYVKVTNNFLCTLDAIKSVPDNTYLVSLEVKSLYTSIPNAEGTKAVKG